MDEHSSMEIDVEDLLKALVAYGCFGVLAGDDYGRDVTALDGPLNCDYPYKFEDRYPDINAEFLREQLVIYLNMEHLNPMWHKNV